MEDKEKFKKVSIILPTYNGEKYIKQAIDSCLNQTYKNLELIIIDDGSSDKTFEIIEAYYQNKQIKYFKNEKNLGLAQSLNIGFEKSDGEYLTWVSDDNFYNNKAIEILVKELISNPKISFVYSSFYQVDENGKIKRKIKSARPKELDIRNCIGPCFLYKREVYEKTGDYNSVFFLAEDYEYWLRVRTKFRFKNIINYLCYYRLHPKSLRFQNYAYKIEEQAQKASDQFVRTSIKHYHQGKVFFYKKDYKSAQKALIKSVILEPLNPSIWKLLIFVSMAILSPVFAEKIRKKIN